MWDGQREVTLSASAWYIILATNMCAHTLQQSGVVKPQELDSWEVMRRSVRLTCIPLPHFRSSISRPSIYFLPYKKCTIQSKENNTFSSRCSLASQSTFFNAYFFSFSRVDSSYFMFGNWKLMQCTVFSSCEYYYYDCIIFYGYHFFNIFGTETNIFFFCGP